MASLATFSKLAAWAVGLGVIASQLTVHSTVPAELLLGAASAVLLWRMILMMDLLPHRHLSSATADPTPAPRQLQLD